MSCGLNLPGCILSTPLLIHTHPPSRSFLGLSWIIRARQSPRTLTGVSAMQLSGTHQPQSMIKSDHITCHNAFTLGIDKIVKSHQTINCCMTSVVHSVQMEHLLSPLNGVSCMWLYSEHRDVVLITAYLKMIMLSTANKWILHLLRSLV